MIYVKSGVLVPKPEEPKAQHIARPPEPLMSVKARSRLAENKTGNVTMSDVLDGHDILFSDEHAELIFAIEKQAERFTEIAAFEEQAAKRHTYNLKHGGKSTMSVAEADMAGLSESCSVGLTSQSFDTALREKYADAELVSAAGRHRQKINGALAPSLLTCRPVSRKEFLQNPVAMDAYWKEWHNLEGKQVFRYETLAEWDTVSRNARVAGKEIHFGYLFGFMVEKGAEFPAGDSRRKFKYRIVFRGNDVKDQNWDVALFQEMASTPTTLEASRYSDLLSTFEGNSMEGRDVEQAYLQAALEGPDTYIQLPKELWSDEMHRMRCPVVKLEKALYGHKNSGAFWQAYCDEKCRAAGFYAFSENWPCVYWSDELELLLIVYVDDMKLSGKSSNMKTAWDRLGQGINLVQPTGDGDGVLNFLGCEHRSSVRYVAGCKIKTVEWDAISSLRRCIAKYEEAVRSITGMYPRMTKADTPLVHEETRTSEHRRPAANEAFYECPSCLDTFPESYMQKHCYFPPHTTRKLKEIWPPLEKPNFNDSARVASSLASAVNCTGDRPGTLEDNYDDVSEWLAGMSGFELRHLDDHNSACEALRSPSPLFPPNTLMSVDRLDKLWDPKRKEAAGGTPTRGVLSGIAAMILMTVMYTSRAARYDVLKGVCFLAKYITIWDTECDWRLHRLMCYLNSTVEDVMMGWVGDDPTLLTCHVYCDADFAGDPYSLKSTSGCHVDIQGPNSRFPTAGMCGGQTSTAASSTEAEIASIHLGLKARGEGALPMLTKILGHFHRKAAAGPHKKLEVSTVNCTDPQRTNGAYQFTSMKTTRPALPA